MVGLCTGSGVELIGGVELAPGDGLGEAAEGVGDDVGGGEVAGALGVHVDGGDELAAGDEGELLGVVAGHGAGAEDEEALDAPVSLVLTGSPPRRACAGSRPSG